MLINCLPIYENIGTCAPAALLVLRFAQGLAFGGEQVGATLVAVESASAVFSVTHLPEAEFLRPVWRVPFPAEHNPCRGRPVREIRNAEVRDCLLPCAANPDSAPNAGTPGKHIAAAMNNALRASGRGIFARAVA